MVKAAGIAARVQGMRRYYALLLCSDGVDGHPTARLVKALDGNTVLAETDFAWEFDEKHDLSLEVVDAHEVDAHEVDAHHMDAHQSSTRLRAWIDGQPVFEARDADRTLSGGGVALVCEEGRTATEIVTVRPAGQLHLAPSPTTKPVDRPRA